MLKLNSISHQFGGHTLFFNLSFTLNDQRYGLVGPNGVGKSTLTQIMTGELTPTAGQVISQGSVLRLAQSEPQTKITLAEYLSEIWEAPTEMMNQLVAPLNLEQTLDQLSGGEWMRARLAKALSKSPSFLILDEPTNNLDRIGKEIVLKFLEDYTGGMLVISHDREILEKMDVILELSNQGLSTFGGNFSFYWESRSQEREKQQADLNEAKRESKRRERERIEKLDQQEKRMRRGEVLAERGGIPKIILGGMKRQAQKSMGKMMRQEKEFVDHSKLQVQDAWQSLKTDPFVRLNFEGARVPNGKTLVSVENFNWAWPEAKEPLWKTAVNLLIQGPQRWHLKGPNGSGKSTLIKHILQISSEKKIAIAYLDQNYRSLDPEKTVLENMPSPSRFDAIEIRNELAFYGFTKDQVFQKVKTLSGGEMLKASLAQMFLGDRLPELIILDEPTNNLDLMGIELLEKALKNFAGAILVVSHDLEFVKNLEITQIWDLA